MQTFFYFCFPVRRKNSWIPVHSLGGCVLLQNSLVQGKVAHSCVSELYSHFYPHAGPDLVRVIPFWRSLDCGSSWSVPTWLPRVALFTSVLCSVPLWDPMNGSPSGSSVHGDSPSKNTREGTHFLLQEIFPILGWNPSLPHCRWVLYCLRHQRSPRILERVAYPFSRGTSPLRNQAGVSCIAGGFFTS